MKNLPGLLVVILARLKSWFRPKNGYGQDSEWLIYSNRLRIFGHSFERSYNDADATVMLERLHAVLAMHQMRDNPPRAAKSDE